MKVQILHNKHERPQKLRREILRYAHNDNTMKERECKSHHNITENGNSHGHSRSMQIFAPLSELHFQCL